MKKRRAPTLKTATDFTKFRLECLEKQFEQTSKALIWQLTEGGGMHNIHISQTLRDLQTLYIDIACHIDALRSLKAER